MPTTTGARAGGETLLQKFRPELRINDRLLAAPSTLYWSLNCLLGSYGGARWREYWGLFIMSVLGAVQARVAVERVLDLIISAETPAHVG